MKMTKVRKVALGLTIAAASLAGTAYAQQGAKGDGVTTRAEVQAKAQQRFARMDANKDGKIDQADREARRAARFDRIDTDKNGQISRAEFDAAGQRGPRAARAAAGADGERDGQKMHRRGGGKHWGQRGGRGGMMMGRMADANKDGAVTQAEFVAAALQRFDRIDADKNGTITVEERRAARQAMRERWQNRTGQPAAPKAN